MTKRWRIDQPIERPNLNQLPIGARHPCHPEWVKVDLGRFNLVFRHEDGREIETSWFGCAALGVEGTVRAVEQLIKASDAMADVVQ